MLTLATLGMIAYGSYSVLVGVTDLLGPVQYAWWADAWLIGAGGMLVLASAFVRVSMPGGLALAVAGLLALQSISLHTASQLYGRVYLLAEIVRAGFATALVALAYFGWEDKGTGTVPARPKD
jgi:hypothetical protein